MTSSVRSPVLGGLVLAVVACAPSSDESRAAGGTGGPAPRHALVVDETPTPNVVRVAVGSADHTTLVAALQAAELVDPLANVGPFTVFAPTNAAFSRLPPGTVESLLKPENRSQLVQVLYHHVTTSALELSFFSEGQSLNMVSGGQVVITRRDGDTYINDAKVLGSVRASNGWVHVIDGVLLR